MEWSLCNLLILVFTLVDITTDSAGKASLVALIVNWWFVVIRQYFGEKNISKKTRIDGRFLI